MTPFDYTKALTDFWSTQAKTMMQAQEEATRALSDRLQAMAGGALPAMSGATDISTTVAEMGRASQAMLDLWSGASALAQQLAAKLPAPQAGDGTMAAVLGKIMDPRQWLAGAGDGDELLGRMAEGPRLADLWQIERRYARVLQATTDVRRRALEQNAVMLQAWMRAGRAFAAEWSGRAGADRAAPDSKAALSLWTETANKELLATQRSEAFLSGQREMIRANTALRVAQRELVEYFGEQYGFPTRTELDDVHRSVTELRRELRALRRQQRGAPASAPAASTAANANPPRRRAQKGAN